MTLLELLVEKLPKHGGWPAGAVECVRFVDEATIDFYDEHGNCPDDCSLTYGAIAKEICVTPTELCQRESVKLEEYDAALAASKPEWDGDGLPPVGAEVECICNEFPNDGQEKILGHILYSGEYTILKTYKTNNQHHAPVESVFKTKSWAIIPIRSEADKKKEKVVDEIMSWMHYAGRAEVELIYDAIKSGKIVID